MVGEVSGAKAFKALCGSPSEFRVAYEVVWVKRVFQCLHKVRAIDGLRLRRECSRFH